jgi:hypothetical protein
VIRVNSTKTTKLISKYSSGLLTESEVATAILFDAVSDDADLTDVASSVAELPDEVHREVLHLLRIIRQDRYRWKPMMLGPGGSISGSETEDSARLRRICLLLDRELLRTT